MKEYTKFFATGDVISGVQQETKMRDNNYYTLKSSKSRPEKWGLSDKLFGQIRAKKPLNCKNPECGSKNLRYSKGSGIHAMKATCKDCGHWYWVLDDIAEAIQHLIEPDPSPPPETRVCRYCGKPATVVDEHYYQCGNCGDRLVRFNFGGEIDE